MLKCVLRFPLYKSAVMLDRMPPPFTPAQRLEGQLDDPACYHGLVAGPLIESRQTNYKY